MARRTKMLATPTHLTTVSANTYTAPSGTVGLVRLLHVTNFTTAAITVRIWVRDVALNAFAIVYDKIVPANEYLEIPTYLPLTAGWHITAQSGAATGLTMFVTGDEIVV